MESKQKLKEIFTLIDSDGGGAITIDEVMGFVNPLPDKVDEAIVRKAFDETDDDGSGEIDEEEFCGLTQKLQEALGVPVEEMVKHFTTHCYKDLFDLFAEGASEVRMSDLRTLVESMGTDISGEELRRIFLKYDEDGSGQIEFEEFIGIVSTIGEGIPISTLVHDFKDARQKAKERMAKLKGAFAEKAEDEPAPVKREKERKAPTPTPPASVKSHTSYVCPTCPSLHTRIADLESRLSQSQTETNNLKSELQSKENGASDQQAAEATSRGKISELEAHVKSLEEKLKKKDGKKKLSSADKENRELVTKCERLERQVSALQAAASGNSGKHELAQLTVKNQQLEKQLEEYKNSDLALLQSQLWSLETALEIRTRELNALRDRTQEFASRMEQFDPSLAQAMRETVRELAAQAEKEAIETLGESVDAVVKNRRAKRKSRKGPEDAKDEKLAAKNKEIQKLEAENKRLQRLASEAKRLSREASMPQHTMQVVRDDREVQMLKAKHKEELQKKDAQLSSATKKLKTAQDAIVAAAGANYENDVKLHQARRSLQYILDNGSPPRSSGSGSPRSTGSPAGSPRAQSPRSKQSKASPSPQQQAPQYSRTMLADPVRDFMQPQPTAHGYSSPVRAANAYQQRSYSPRTVVHSPPPPPAAYQSPTRRYA